MTSPPPPTDVGPAATLGVQGTGQEVGQRSSQNRQGALGGGTEDGAPNHSGMWAGQALMEEGAHPHPSRQP